MDIEFVFYGYGIENYFLFYFSCHREIFYEDNELMEIFLCDVKRDGTGCNCEIMICSV